VPNVQLNGRQSKIVTTDYHFGQHTLLYCSSDILTWGTFDRSTVLVLYLDIGQAGEFAFTDVPSDLSYQTYGSSNVSDSSGIVNGTSGSSSSTFTKYAWTQTAGPTVVKFSNGLTIYLVDLDTAWTFFAPATTSNPHISPNEQVFVLGPYLVRDVNVFGETIELQGDNANTTSLEVYAAHASSVVWNGRRLATKRTPYGSLIASVAGANDVDVALPTLSWVVANSLPEADRDYDDSKWVICNNSTTLSPVAPLTLPVREVSYHLRINNLETDFQFI